jgi:hypothetical protein
VSEPTHVCLDCGALGTAGGYHDHGNQTAGDTIPLSALPAVLRSFQAIEDERDEFRAENERLKAERQAVLDVVNLYGDETLHKALDMIGWPSVPELVERSRALGPVMEAQGERVAQGLLDAADRMRDEGENR